MTPLELLRARRHADPAADPATTFPRLSRLTRSIDPTEPGGISEKPGCALSVISAESPAAQPQNHSEDSLSSTPLDESIAASEARKRSLPEIISIADRVAARARRPDAMPQDRLIADDWRRIRACKEREPDG